ncbi:hypothetical protein HYT02_05870 [Candidatus Gottesmanbacteria bacterium]|nr:hypothetical protein [Candidatus Gottesmanbacteria bacterium]
MQATDPAFLYLALILPSLFSLTLIAEGIHKIQQQEQGWIPITLGVFFILTIIVGYFLIFH